MKYIYLIFILGLLFTGCGYKTDPKYTEDVSVKI